VSYLSGGDAIVLRKKSKKKATKTSVPYSGNKGLRGLNILLLWKDRFWQPDPCCLGQSGGRWLLL